MFSVTVFPVQATCLVMYVHVLFPLPRLPLHADGEMYWIMKSITVERNIP